tara:strand:- start:54 stop:383 length:330 start_codon:yes stop_codon:yes gene_type:complete
MTSDINDDMSSFVLPNLKDISQFDIAVNKSGQVYLFYTKQLSAEPEYAEFDAEMNTLSFLDEMGRVQDSGLEIQNSAKSHLQKADFITLVQVSDEFKIQKARNIQLISR